MTPRTNQTIKTNQAAAGSATSVVLPAIGIDRRWRLRKLSATYGLGATGALTITTGTQAGGTPVVLWIADGGAFDIDFPDGLQCGPGDDVTIALAAVASNVPKLSVIAVTE